MTIHIIMLAILSGIFGYVCHLTRRVQRGQPRHQKSKKTNVEIDEVVKVFAIYREYMTNEGNLINFRMTWLIAINGFLFATSGLLIQRRLDIVGDSSKSSLLIQVDLFLMGVFATAFLISLLAAHSIRDAKVVARTLSHHFEASYHVEQDGELRFISVGQNGERLPLIAGAGKTKGSTLGSHASMFIPWLLCLTWYLAFWYVLSSHSPF